MLCFVYNFDKSINLKLYSLLALDAVLYSLSAVFQLINIPSLYIIGAKFRYLLVARLQPKVIGYVSGFSSLRADL